jgi:L-histidine N-alpha-methyltransferase
VSLASPDITLDRHIDPDSSDTLAADVRDGLTRDHKELAPKYFYDARGSELFDRITMLPEYYPTRAEREILNRRAPEIVAETGTRELVELGSGMASKTRALLYAMAGSGALRRYVPFDVDESVVEGCAAELVEHYPGLSVHGVVGDFEHHLELIPPGEDRIFAFLGGTIGNLFPEERAAFLTRLRGLMGPGDRLVLGTDLVKDRAMLEAAYDDSQGVTAQFNKNVLAVINARLDADFDLDAFEHVAVFDERASRIEMRLRSLGDQTVHIPGAGIDAHFAGGETMRTEISTKFTPESVERVLGDAGLQLEHLYTDSADLFALSVSRLP